ncbi:hypothetical protein KKB55_04865 [Myxococcota bacterium]|nr:hypothetical protein [Myxococcota bacterium]MBU1897084.1 hypothetical protein [Myxococcota bacterium]
MYTPPPLSARAALLYAGLGLLLGGLGLAGLAGGGPSLALTALQRLAAPTPTPPDETTAAHLLKSARVSLDAKRRGRNLSDQQPFEDWTLTLYLPATTTARRCCGGPCPSQPQHIRPQHIRRERVALSSGLTPAIEALWARLSPEERGADLSRSVFVVDQIAATRPVWGAGGWRGAALTLGRDGVRLIDDEGRVSLTLPGWALDLGWRRATLIEAARREAMTRDGWSEAAAAEASIDALRTHSWVESRRGPLPLALGQPMLEGDIDAPMLRARILAAGRYLARETCPNGRITYDYDPFSDEEGAGYNLLRHAGATLALLQVWRLTRDDQIFKAAGRALRWLEGQIKVDLRFEGDRFTVFEGLSKIGGTALTLIALIELESAAPGSVHPDILTGLATHLRRMQHPSGDFRSYYDWDQRGDVPALKSGIYAHQALLALLRYSRLRGDPETLEAARRGARFALNARWRGAGLPLKPLTEPWLIQALVELDSPDQDRLDALWAAGDRLRAQQITDEAAGPLRGGFAWDGALPNLVSASARLEALIALARLAGRRGGDERFKTAALMTAGYLLSQQLREGGLYATPHPARARGGLPAWPGGPIYMDGVQHAISGLIGLLQILEPEAQPTPGAQP